MITTKMQQEQFYKETSALAKGLSETPPDTPQCCGTGCTVCVLDYPELFSNNQADSETLAMLEAIEQAQLQAGQLLVETDSESQ